MEYHAWTPVIILDAPRVDLGCGTALHRESVVDGFSEPSELGAREDADFAIVDDSRGWIRGEYAVNQPRGRQQPKRPGEYRRGHGVNESFVSTKPRNVRHVVILSVIGVNQRARLKRLS
jgi:hypothetical protein